MTVLEAFTAVLREQLGPGYEAATLGVMVRAYARRSLAPAVKAKLKSALDTSSIVADRLSAEAVVKNAEAQLRALQAQVDADVDAQIGAV